ncbi:MAG: efflux RND transporter periplasmic adaptor subunit [Candidatus Anaerobiospirillum pullicola]|uniref:Efflux RND transporter periplasmic adaptor subunit n=1 Tax=Candidatus Anaerobiospirillum pullicola TaxID=2838451 RepID=A0A948TGT5_9GAMM|nr:efflux RND transporter periplasmic adaptor subunit [Candidatus Anaerobiospirillum pullicola]
MSPKLRLVITTLQRTLHLHGRVALIHAKQPAARNHHETDLNVHTAACLRPRTLRPLWWGLLGSSVLLLSACNQEAKVASTPSLAEVEYAVTTIHPQFKNRERSYTLSGRVGAYTRADVRPQVDGIILNRLFEEGSQVMEGTPLYEIDPAPFRASFDHALASYQRATVQRKMAAKDYERFESLYKRRSASEKERDDALLAYELAVADEKLYKAALDQAQISLNYTTVRAPISGIIGTSQITRGALVNANQSEPLATITDLDKVYVDMEQSALEWRRLREGLLDGTIYLSDHAYDVALYFEDGTLYSRLGVLSLSEVLVDESSGSISMRASFDNPDHILLPGMAVVCKISGGVTQNVMTVPAQAVTRDPKGRAFVFTVEKDRVLQTPVTLGQLYNDGWQIVAGLDSSMEVVISGNAVLHHGSKIKVTNRDGIDLTTADIETVAQQKRAQNQEAAVQAVVNPTVSASGLEQSSANVPTVSTP